MRHFAGKLLSEAIDGRTLRYLLKKNLARKKEEEEEEHEKKAEEEEHEKRMLEIHNKVCADQPVTDAEWDPLAEVAEPQGGAAAVGYVAAGAALLMVPALHGEDSVDGTIVSFLLRENLKQTRKRRMRGGGEGRLARCPATKSSLAPLPRQGGGRGRRRGLL